MIGEYSVLQGKETFTSPQTESVYKKVYDDGKYILCYRSVTDGTTDYYRVRIQGTHSRLTAISGHLSTDWGLIKAGDHLSVVIKQNLLPVVVGDVYKALISLALTN